MEVCLRTVTKFLGNLGDIENAKQTLTMLPVSWIFVHFWMGIISFHVGNIGFARQRAFKLLAVKVGGLKKTSAAWPWPLSATWPGFEADWVRMIPKVWQTATLKTFDLQTHIYFMEISKPILMYISSLACWHHFYCFFCRLKVNSFS